MQAQYLIDKSLAKKLIDFFGQEWINNYSSYSHYTAEQAAKSAISHIEFYMTKGFEITWSLGGTSNNCWGDSYSISAEIEPELPMLDEFFMEAYPAIGFMQYKIVTKAVQRSTYSDSDYYGGSTENGKKSLSFSDFSQAMIKAKVISDPQVVRLSDLDSYIQEQFGVEKMLSIFKPKVKKVSKKTDKIKKML